MLRVLLPVLLTALAMPLHAASLKDYALQQSLEKIATQSSLGTPRAINEDILDYGYQVQNTELINLLGVRPSHAAQMRANPENVRSQLRHSVCQNAGFRQLLNQGAQLRYEFRELGNDLLVAREYFTANDCTQP